MLVWILDHALLVASLLLPLLIQAVLLVRDRRALEGAHGAAIILVGTWLLTFVALTLSSPAMRYLNDPKRLAGWLLALGIGSLIPFLVAQSGSMLARRVKSEAAYGTAIFAAGVFIGAPLMIVVGRAVWNVIVPSPSGT